MSKKSVEKRHSETALFGALYRAMANKEFGNRRFGPDDLAECFLPAHFKFFIKFKRIRAKAITKGNRLTPGIYEYMLARTAFFDGVFVDALRKNTPQIVLLGAGYDTRAYRFADLNRATKIIELDIATTQNRKKQCLKKFQVDVPAQVVFAPIDFNKDSLDEVLESAGYEIGKKTLFIWEGVTYYLEPESVDATLESVRNSTHEETIMAFDYAISISEDNIDNYYGVRQFIETWAKHRTGEPFKFSIEEGGAASFLEQRGLKMVSHLSNKEIEKTFLTNENGSLLGQITGSFRFASASPLGMERGAKSMQN